MTHRDNGLDRARVHLPPRVAPGAWLRLVLIVALLVIGLTGAGVARAAFLVNITPNGEKEINLDPNTTAKDVFFHSEIPLAHGLVADLVLGQDGKVYSVGTSGLNRVFSTSLGSFGSSADVLGETPLADGSGFVVFVNFFNASTFDTTGLEAIPMNASGQPSGTPFTFAPPSGTHFELFRFATINDTAFLLGNDSSTGNGALAAFMVKPGSTPGSATLSPFGGNGGFHSITGSGSQTSPTFLEDGLAVPGGFDFAGTGLSPNGPSNFFSDFAVIGVDPNLSFTGGRRISIGARGGETDLTDLIAGPSGDLFLAGREGTDTTGNGVVTRLTPTFADPQGWSNFTLPQGSYIARIFNPNGLPGSIGFIGNTPSGGGVTGIIGTIDANTGAQNSQPDTFGGTGALPRDETVLPDGTVEVDSRAGDDALLQDIFKLEPNSPPPSVDLSVAFVNPTSRLQVGVISKWTVRVTNDGTVTSDPTRLVVTLDNTPAASTLDMSKDRTQPDVLAFRNPYHALQFDVPAIGAGGHEDFSYYVGPNDFIFPGDTGPVVHHAMILADGDPEDGSPPSGDDLATFPADYVTDASTQAASPCGGKAKAIDARTCSIPRGHANSFHGAASGALKQVQVAIERASGGARVARAKRSRAQCESLAGKSGRLKKSHSTHGYCMQLNWIAAHGTKHWTLKLRHSLPPGNYILYVRPVTPDGAPVAGFRSSAHNRVAFSVR